MRKPVIGLIGGIGAGKSVVAAALAARGGAVVDCDRLGHEVLDQPAVAARIAEYWSERVLRADGSVNRRALGDIVFANPEERRRLEELVYPAIKERASGEIESALSDSSVRFVVLDAAVMLEAGWHDVCDRILHVDAPREMRVRRLAERSGWSESELAARESAQWPLERKRTRADAVVVNDGSLETLRERLDAVLQRWGIPSE